MTVEELIQELQRYDNGATVVVKTKQGRFYPKGAEANTRLKDYYVFIVVE